MQRMVRTRSSSPGVEMPTASPRQVMLVETNPVDAAHVADAFQGTRTWNHVSHFDEGRSALAHLRHEPLERPMLILLAWDVPDGSEFLAALKADERLRTIPLVILAASGAIPGVSASFALGAAGYLVKSADPAQLREDLATVCAYWALSELPRP